MTISSHGVSRGMPGPTVPLTEVFGFYEGRGHRDPAAVWRAFTATYNWAAPLTTAVPRTGPARTVTSEPVAGGFTLSGQWRLRTREASGGWVALPLTDGLAETARGAAAPGGPDLFVVAAETLSAVAGTPGEGSDGAASSGRLFRLTDARVPAGFATHTDAAVSLRAREAPFLWTAVAGMALGAGRRMTDELPDAGTAAERLRGGDTAGSPWAELAGLLHNERLSTAAALYGSPAAGEGLPTVLQERLAARTGQVANIVHHVLAAAYQRVLATDGDSDRHRLVRVIEASSPILQLVRYATELLPPGDRTSRRKAEQGDDRRISG